MGGRIPSLHNSAFPQRGREASLSWREDRGEREEFWMSLWGHHEPRDSKADGKISTKCGSCLLFPSRRDRSKLFSVWDVWVQFRDACLINLRLDRKEQREDYIFFHCFGDVLWDIRSFVVKNVILLQRLAQKTTKLPSPKKVQMKAKTVKKWCVVETYTFYSFNVLSLTLS